MDTVADAPGTVDPILDALVDPRWRLLTAPVVGWALYDFANTIFSFSVITRYFNDWIIDERHRPDWNIGLMSAIVGLLLVVAMPMMGAVSDRVGRRLPFLGVWTGACIVLTASIGFIDSTVVAIVVGGMAIFTYQLALSMYDPLLANVAPPARRGSVSGLGIGTGYLGTLVALPILTLLVPDHHSQQAFVPTAIMFAVASLPIFLFVRDHATWRRSDVAASTAVVQVADPTGPSPVVSAPPVASIAPDANGARQQQSLGATMVASIGQVVRTTQLIRRDHRDVGRFLIARFLYVDAIATVIAFLAVYLDRVGGFSSFDKNALLFLSTIAGVAGGFVAGRIVERRGPKAVLQLILLVAIGALVVAAGFAVGPVMWVVGPFVGLTLGCVWTSDRVFMFHLAPPALRGEFFGIYNLVGKLSSGFGPLVLWGGTIWLLHTRLDAVSLLGASRVALAVLAVAVLAGWLVLRPLADDDRHVGVTDQAGA